MSDFEAFRRKLADAVTIAINSDRRVSAADEQAFCPLGCLSGSPAWRPSSSALSRWLPRMQARAFIFGFDHGSPPPPMFSDPDYRLAGDDLKAFELGKLYRARFP